jgi:hypothetical protein
VVDALRGLQLEEDVQGVGGRRTGPGLNSCPGPPALTCSSLPKCVVSLFQHQF